MRSVSPTLWSRSKVPLTTTAVYAVTFIPLYRAVGDGILALSALPIVVAGHALGRWGGAAAAVLLTAFNYLALDWAGRWPPPLGPRAPFWFAAIVLTGMGFLAGFFGEARMAVDREILRRQQTEGELRDALSEVRTLRGLVPICASCKKIRGDDDTWVPVEQFVQERSEASFTHGFCPACLSALDSA